MTDAPDVRALEYELASAELSAQPDTRRRVDLLNRLAWALSDTDMQRARQLSETAYALAEAPGEGERPYEAGRAYSLRTQGYLNQRLGDYPTGLRQLLQAQSVFEALGLEDGLADVFDGLAGIYGQIGDLAEALAYMHKQLDAAQRIGDDRRVANALNNVGHVYTELADYDMAIDTFQRNLVLALETGNQRIETLSRLNLADVYLLLNDYEAARREAQLGLRLAHTAGYPLFEAYGYDIVAKARLKQGDTAEALRLSAQALALSQSLGSSVTDALFLLHMGEAYRAAGQIDRALACLQESVATAEAIEARNELFKAHLMLSELYEQQGDTTQALAHYKEYQAVKELVQGERADQRLKVLHVAYDTERAKREVSDTIALLKSEIAERERAEAEIRELVTTLESRVAARTDELATFFDLTLLAGQAATLEDALEQALPRILDVTRSEAVSVYLLGDDRTALRLAASLNLPRRLPATAPLKTTPARFQTWLAQPADPLLTMSLSKLTILPRRLRIPDFQSHLSAQIRIGSRIEGFLSCYRVSDRGFGLDEVALGTALAEQIGMMLATQRLRQNAHAVAVVAERQRLARDLHDSVTQSLYSLSLFARAGREAVEDGDVDRLTLSLAELERTSLQALREMRLLLYELRPADLEHEGLTRAIQLRLNTVERRTGLRLTVHLDELRGLAPRYEVELYHIIVEALNNVIKHAAATSLSLELTRRDGQIVLRMNDDGQGFDPRHVSGGMGLRNIRERVSHLGGRLTIISAPGDGATLEAVIPDKMEVRP